MKIILTAAVLTISGIIPCYASMTVNVESNYVSPGYYNDVQIPKKSGTRFSLTDDFKTESSFGFRSEIVFGWGKRHSLSVFYAPLSLKASGTSEFDISFNGRSVPAGSEIEGIYRFDSYRSRYRYTITDTARVKMAAGFTAKIRDAGITLKSGDVTISKLNTGFVPLLNFLYNIKLNDRWQAEFDIDAMFSPYGRAEDAFLGLRYEAVPGRSINIGYRIVEGGADVDEVYNFTLIHYAVLGVSVKM